MGTKINHVAIVSETYGNTAQFYQAVFGFRSPSQQRNFNSATVGDGYVGLNINPRRPARPAGLDHFGVEVDDVQSVLSTMKDKYPNCHALQRPSNRPFAGLTAHDPDGNVFDISQREMANRGEIYSQMAEPADAKRKITHFAVRTMNPEKVANFYVDVLDLAMANKAENDPNFYLTDGRMTLVILPWSIMDFAGTGIVRSGPNHIGITVESLDALERDIKKIVSENPSLVPHQISTGPEGEALRKILADSVPYAQKQMADNTNVLLAISESH
jgi:catechol 2,3-dioxygenase-like lactoylglutathione lyase family enzyme